MTSATTKKSDRFQILMAVLLMSAFATALLILGTTRDRIGSFLCGYVDFGEICSNTPSANTVGASGELINSQIISACVDTEGLKISVAFGAPLAGTSSIQVFTTGEDVFPGEQGMEDSFRMSRDIPTATDQLDLVIPVESMPVGEHIFGNIIMSEENVISSHVAYFVAVTDCLSSAVANPNPTLLTDYDTTPIDFNATCLSENRLRLAFEFNRPVFGQYLALVNNMPYGLVSVGNQPAALFFSGAHPPEDTVHISLISATDQNVMFEETLTLPICESN
jgi:hypothetical protein